MTSIGWGDITPITALERGFVVVFMMISSCIWATFLAGFAAIESSLNQRRREYNSFMDETNHVMADNHLPPKLRVRIRQHIMQTFDGGNRPERLVGLMRRMSP